MVFNYNILFFPYSTLAMRSAGGMDVIKKAVEQLSKYHDRHIRLYDPTLVSIHLLEHMHINYTNNTVFLLKIWHENNNTALASPNF